MSDREQSQNAINSNMAIKPLFIHYNPETKTIFSKSEPTVNMITFNIMKAIIPDWHLMFTHLLHLPLKITFSKFP